MTENGTPRRGKALRATGIGCGAVLLLAVVGLVYVVADTPYPRVEPAVMAQRVSGNAQDAYAALGIARTVEPGFTDHSDNNTYGVGDCYGDGLLSGLQDKQVEGAYRLHQSWSVTGVGEEARPALGRLRDHLEATGWRVSAFGPVGRSEDLEVRANKGEYAISVEWEPKRARLRGHSGGECAQDPSWMGGAGVAYREPDLGRPPALRPASTVSG
ncbi:hypothetical protein [Streptomyces sp. URMC 123]|uniref:hypothetical protein n=1 Tax=Streptomyces sp. URMC 123 TaxID=3423403 RepID=UPI003F1C4081